MFLTNDFNSFFTEKYGNYLKKLEKVSDTKFTKQKDPKEVLIALNFIVEFSNGFSLTDSDTDITTYYENLDHCLKSEGSIILQKALNGSLKQTHCPFLENIDDRRCVVLTSEEIGILDELENWVKQYR